MNRLMVGLPCYNEEENIAILMEKWEKEKNNIQDLGYELIIVPLDDKSTDSTKSILEEYNKKYENIKPIYHKTNKNLGGGMNTLINHFSKNFHDGDLLIIMDGDNTQDPKFSPKMIKKSSEADVVIASRYQKGSEVRGVSPIRLFYSYGALIYYSMILRVPNVKDYTCGYRLYSYEILKKGKDKYKDDLIVNKSFACMMELLYKLYVVGGEFREVPFVLRYDNKGGASEIDVVKTIKDSLTTAIKIKRES